MSKIVDAILNVVRPYFWVLLVLVLFAIFSVAGYYGYQKYAKDVITKTKFADVANADRNNKNATIMMFFVDWCPHCKTSESPSGTNLKQRMMGIRSTDTK